MRKIFGFCILAVLVLALGGCSDSDPPPVFEANILSDQPSDGDIVFDFQQTFIITQGPDTLFFGIDELGREFRAFLDFPLDGSTGYDVVPIPARIVSATLEVFIDEVSFANIVPTLIDLVIYPVAGLREVDFDSPPLMTVALDFLASDQGRFVSIDVTPLMRETQRRGLTEFQVRFLLDFSADAGFVGIEDLPRVSVRAPLLIVLYTP